MAFPPQTMTGSQARTISWNVRARRSQSVFGKSLRAAWSSWRNKRPSALHNFPEMKKSISGVHIHYLTGWRTPAPFPIEDVCDQERRSEIPTHLWNNHCRKIWSSSPLMLICLGLESSDRVHQAKVVRRGSVEACDRSFTALSELSLPEPNQIYAGCAQV